MRLSGPDPKQILLSLTSRSRLPRPRVSTLCRISGLDAVLVVLFEGPLSFTGEDVCEISSHGNPVILDEIVERAVRAGARHAAPGEFSFRAVLHGRMDLVQAEAVRDLIESRTAAQAAQAFDQLDGTVTRELAALEGALFDLEARLEACLDFSGEGYAFIEPAEVRECLDVSLARARGLLGRRLEGS